MPIKRWHLLVVLGLLLGTGSAKDKKPAVVVPAPTAADYVIGAEDILGISVWHEPEMSRVVPVRPDGKI